MLRCIAVGNVASGSKSTLSACTSLKVVCNLDFVIFVGTHPPMEGRVCVRHKPCRRAKLVLLCHRYQPVMHCVVVDVVQLRIITCLMGETGIPKLEPYLASKCAILLVDRPRRSRMKTL